MRPFHIRTLAADTRGATLIEFAIVLPVLAMMLFGMVMYAHWFLLAHSVQQTANDAVRAGLAGLSVEERAGLVRATVASDMAQLDSMNPAAATTSIQDDGAALVVAVRYDASADPMLSMSLLPPPPPLIVRSAAAQISGF